MTGEAVGILVAICALLGPALVLLGVKIGTLTKGQRAASNLAQAAHKRIDRHEEKIEEGFKELRHVLAEGLKNGWRHCPLAMDAHHPRKHDD